MRNLILAGTLATLAACSNPNGADNAVQAAPADNAAAAAKSAPTAAQQQALDVARSYVEHVSRGDYAKAHDLWDDEGAASGGSVADLKASYARYTSFAGRVGEASAVSTSSGKQHVVVSAFAKVVEKKTGATRDIDGFVYLRRADDTAPWRIWGVDIRPR